MVTVTSADWNVRDSEMFMELFQRSLQEAGQPDIVEHWLPGERHLTEPLPVGHATLHAVIHPSGEEIELPIEVKSDGENKVVIR